MFDVTDRQVCWQQKRAGSKYLNTGMEVKAGTGRDEDALERRRGTNS